MSLRKSCDKSEAIFTKIILTPKMNMTHRARGCPFIANVDGEDFVIDGFAKYKGYGDECETIYFAGVALFQDVEKKLVFQFCFEYSYDTDEYKCIANISAMRS